MPIQCASSKKCIVGWSTTPADFIVDFKSALLANFFAAAASFMSNKITLHSSDSHARVRQRMPKRIEMSDLVH